MLNAFDTLLVANRGEIACRIIRSARALGLRTVAVCSDADLDAPHVDMADDVVRIGPGPAAQSYLDPKAIIQAACQTGAQAIHPGYGFLSENADFARAVAEAGLVFVGPSAQAIAIMGEKAGAKRAMIAAGVPCVPGYQGEDQADATLVREAERIGYPVMVKASAGGGGRGMRLVPAAADLPEALDRARSEAMSAFGSDRLILEKALLRPRHVEVQILADGHGHVLHLGERDCSVQRRHQKVVEEAPCPVMTPQLRAAMGAAAVAAARAVDYRGAGTVEFLLDETGEFHFLEMNTRLQVEHPVTEMITGIDLVAWQIRIARGEALPMQQEEIGFKGHAIEARLYAEEPARGFLPSTGRIRLFEPATGPGIRIDSGVRSGQQVSPFYDPMLAKLVAWGETREIARARLLSALERTALVGVATNAGFLAGILRTPAFVQGGATTAFIEETWPDGIGAEPPCSSMLAAGAALLLQAQMHAALDASPMADESLCGFASDGGLAVPVELAEGDRIHTLAAHALGPSGWTVSGAHWSHEVRLDHPADAWRRITVDGRSMRVAMALEGEDVICLQAGAANLTLRRHRPRESATGAATGRIVAPMPGLVVALQVACGETVEEGQIVAVMEAMKMQHQLRADMSGRLTEIAVAAGAQVASGALVAVIGKDEGCV